MVSSREPMIKDIENGNTPTEDSRSKAVFQDVFQDNSTFTASCSLLAFGQESHTSINAGIKYDVLTPNTILGNLVKAEVDDKMMNSRFHLSIKARFYVLFLVIPTLISLVFAGAMIFPPETCHKFPLLLWTDGALTKNEDDKWTICPRDVICSEGVVQIILTCISRVTAFASYTIMGITFIAKMHCTINWLSSTQAVKLIPLEILHKIHKKAGTIYFMLALLHTVGHIIRWLIRQETMKRVNSMTGISGIIGLFAMMIVVVSMSPWMKTIATFERRLDAHYLCFVFAGAMCFHTGRCRGITVIFIGLWILDYIYGRLYKTYILDMVRFTPLPFEAGVQILWRNPDGFRVRSGDYIKIKLPWLSEGSNEWHAFSIYFPEANDEGQRSAHSSHGMKVGEGASGQDCDDVDDLCEREVHSQKTAMILIGFENEFASPVGKLSNGIQWELSRTGMLNKTAMLAEVARTTGAHVFYVPFTTNEKASDHQNTNVDVTKDCRDNNLCINNTWNTEFMKDHKPQTNGIVVEGNTGLDSFHGSNMQELLQEKGIETVIIGAFLANHWFVEATMHTAYELGYNIITLTDGVCNIKHQHPDSTEDNFKLFSTPMSCQQASAVLRGEIPTTTNNPCSPTIVSTYSQSSLSLKEFIVCALTRQNEDYKSSESTLIRKEAHADMTRRYQTTKVFIAPLGDWSKRVIKETNEENHLQSCWLRGPYTSPYSITCNFKHMVLVASGSGITSTLAVMGQNSGSSRAIFLVWTTRCPNMLKFFAPLLRDALVAAVFYTGKDYVFTDEEMAVLQAYGNIYIEQRRPENLAKTIESLIETYEDQSERNAPNMCEGTSIVQEIRESTIASMNGNTLHTWCVLYCGGSQRMKYLLRKFTKKKGIAFESELNNW